MGYATWCFGMILQAAFLNAFYDRESLFYWNLNEIGFVKYYVEYLA